MSNRQSGRRVPLAGLIAVLAGATQVVLSIEIFAQILSSRAEPLLAAIFVYPAICAWWIAHTLIWIRTDPRINTKRKPALRDFLVFVYVIVVGIFYLASRSIQTEIGLLYRFIAFAMVGVGLIWAGALNLLGYIK